MYAPQSTTESTIESKALTCVFNAGTYFNRPFACAIIHLGHYTECSFVNCHIRGGTFVNCTFRTCKKEPEATLIDYHEMKECSSCYAWKPVSCFSKNCNAVDRLQAKCKDCFSLYYRQNKNHMKRQQREYHLTVREDPIVQARAEARHSLKKALETAADWMVSDECGCDWNFLQEWLWITGKFYAPNIPSDSLVIDHFRPLASFDLQGEGRRWVNHWSNLRRITHHENTKKHASIPTEHEEAIHRKLAEGFHKRYMKRQSCANGIYGTWC